MTRDDLLKALGCLYTPEFGDWEITLHHTLTEPTCPTAMVRPEDGDIRFGGFVAMADTIDEAIDGALIQAYETLILRKGFEPGVPWTNADDEPELARIIAALDAKAG